MRKKWRNLSCLPVKSDKHSKKRQTKDKENEKNIIVFPDNIKAIGISFVQGMMTDEIIKYGKQGVLEHFEFKSNNANVVEKIIESINF